MFQPKVGSLIRKSVSHDFVNSRQSAIISLKTVGMKRQSYLQVNDIWCKFLPVDTRDN